MRCPHVTVTSERRFNLLVNDVLALATTSKVHLDPQCFRRAPRMAAAKVDVVRAQFKFMSLTTDQVCVMLVALCTPWPSVELTTELSF